MSKIVTVILIYHRHKPIDLIHTITLVELSFIGGKVPQDRTIVRQVLRTVSLPLFICMWTISCIGIMAAIALIVFNIWYRHRRYIFLKIVFSYKII
jgi:hypothetical protein